MEPLLMSFPHVIVRETLFTLVTLEVSDLLMDVADVAFELVCAWERFAAVPARLVPHALVDVPHVTPHLVVVSEILLTIRLSALMSLGNFPLFVGQVSVQIARLAVGREVRLFMHSLQMPP